MGFDIKDNTVFLEFYGLPGCGKSTVTHLVAERLRKQGKTVIEPTYDLDHRYSAGKRKAIKFLKLIRYAVFRPGRYKRLTQLIKANGYSGAELVYQVANIAPKLWAYENIDAEYVIFDEGLTQSAISLCQGKTNRLENEEALYNLCRQRTVQKYYIKVDIETALERMFGRKQHDSRIEKINDPKEQREALKAFEELCEKITGGDTVCAETKDETINVILDCLHEKEAGRKQ